MLRNQSFTKYIQIHWILCKSLNTVGEIFSHKLLIKLCKVLGDLDHIWSTWVTKCSSVLKIFVVKRIHRTQTTGSEKLEINQRNSETDSLEDQVLQRFTGM